jgi:hypothetical protein
VAALCLIVAGPAVVRAQGYGYAAADSADAADAALDGVDAGDVADVTDALEDGRATGSGRVRRAFFARAEYVGGYRSSTRVTAGTRRLAAGAYRADDARSLWVDARPGGWLERVTVGGLRFGAGEGLVLGATQSRFGGARPARGGLSVDPSLSVSRPREGVAVALRFGSVRLASAVWDGRDGSSGRWVTIERVGGAGGVAASGGMLVDADGSGRVAASVSGGRDVDGVRVSGEVARLGASVLALVRTTVDAGGEWTVEVFDGAAAAGGGVADVDGERRERGAAFHREVTRSAWRSTSSLWVVARRGPGGGRIRRRAGVRAVYTSSAKLRCDLSARVDLDEENEVPTARLSDRVEKERARHARLRARLDVPAGSSMTLRYHAQALLDPASRPGYVAGLDLCWAGHRGEVRASVSNFALWSGSTATVARPGIAGYEAVTPVSRRGSDVSARATLRLAGGAALSVYAGVPWEREVRALVSVSWAL